ncbi:hypothetical protein [Achromobacter insolitus]|uniref:Uncharacterized protein n=1 Tax=Achromobacter insolitus TaxID=217204 RepID=A0A6S7F080_9BURK|nr:hypothetical protein [Achromobacter insolitus]CAB3931588.1 hypothetical protein LMG6000_02229 [Achromobacter insolitus]CAB3939459.1 hypothetical protein LMG5997_04046 [Achromobacter insolitus]
MDDLDALIPLAAMIPAALLIWLAARVLVSAAERSHAVKAFIHDPVLFILVAGLVFSIVGMLLWIGTQGALPLGKSALGVAGFGLAALVWHEAYTRKRPPVDS